MTLVIFAVFFATLAVAALGSSIYMASVNLKEDAPWFHWIPVASNACVGVVCGLVFSVLMGIL